MVSYSFIASHLFLFPLFLSATAMTVPSLSLKNRAAPLIPRHSLSVSLSISLCLLTYLSTSHICHCNVGLGRGRNRQCSGCGPNLDRPGLRRNETRKPRGKWEREGEGRAASLCIHPPTAFLRTCPELRKNNDRPRALSSAFGRLDSATDEIGPRFPAKAAVEG